MGVIQPFSETGKKKQGAQSEDDAKQNEETPNSTKDMIQGLKTMSREALLQLQQALSSELARARKDTSTQTEPLPTEEASTTAFRTIQDSEQTPNEVSSMLLVRQTGLSEVIGPTQNNQKSFLIVDTPSRLISIPVDVLLHMHPGFQTELLQLSGNVLSDSNVSHLSDILSQWFRR